MKMKRQLLDVLDEAHDFDIPQGMMDAELEGITNQIEQERKADPDSDGEITDEEREELEYIAERRVRLGSGDCRDRQCEQYHCGGSGITARCYR